MKKCFIVLAVLLFLVCACKKENYYDANTRLMNMESYVSDISVKYISEKSEVKYEGRCFAKNDGRYRIEITSPRDSAGDYVAFDGKLVWHYSKSNDDKISVSPPDRAERREIILFSLIENAVKNGINDNEKNTVSAALNVKHRLMETEKLFMNSETLDPEKLVIYDKDGKERVIVEFTNFKYNEKTDDSLFGGITDGGNENA